MPWRWECGAKRLDQERNAGTAWISGAEERSISTAERQMNAAEVHVSLRPDRVIRVVAEEGRSRFFAEETFEVEMFSFQMKARNVHGFERIEAEINERAQYL